MSQNQSEFRDDFGRTLSGLLKKHKEEVRSDFHKDVLYKLRLQQDRKLLSKVILQERLLLAGCIICALCILTVILLSDQAVLDFDKFVENAQIVSNQLLMGIRESIDKQQELWIFTIATILFSGYGFFKVHSVQRH